MNIGSFCGRISPPLGKNALAGIRVRALRRGVWFRVLTRTERIQMNLTIIVVKRIRSLFLARVVTSIVEKLLDAMEGTVARLKREVGSALAAELSGIAQKWGNRSARKWSEDPGFVQYLAIMHLNNPRLSSERIALFRYLG